MLEQMWDQGRGVRGAAGRLVAAAGVLAALAGCSESDGPGSLTTYPVSGKVTLADGKPLASGVVVFAAPERGMEFSAPVGDDGSFTLKTPYGDGAPEGTYKVRIERDPSKADAHLRGKKAAAPVPYPAKYGDETTSGLTAVVRPSPNALEPFVLAK